MANANRPLIYDTKILLKTTNNEHEFLKKFAENHKTSMSEVIRSLIADLKEKEEVKQQEMAF